MDWLGHPQNNHDRNLSLALADDSEALTDALDGRVAVTIAIQPRNATDGGSSSARVYPLETDPNAERRWLLTIEASDTLPGTSRSSLDPLTNLPDVAFIQERLKRALSPTHGHAGPVILFCVDLDRFADVNNECGRAIGDLVLIEAARRLGRSIRATSVLGRLSEDMFIVVVQGPLSTEQMTAVASRLIGSIADPFLISGWQVPIHISASVGIAEAGPETNDESTLIDQAVAAVELAKRTGQGTYQFYTAGTRAASRERRSQVNRLRRAIEDGQLRLSYQPKVSLTTGNVVGAEALVRWQEEDGRTVMPGDFIQLAEDAGLIHELGRTVLREAVTSLARWQDLGLHHLRLAINASAREIARPEFFGALYQRLTAASINPGSLEIEITESAIMERAEEVIRSLRSIRDIGVHLSADDFGTGYASLSYLRNFPLDGIKIDTEFVADIDAVPEDGGGLAAGVIAVGHSLGMNVVAEGVETERQLKFLRQYGCDEVQGYLISKPMPWDEFVEFAQKGPVIRPATLV